GRIGSVAAGAKALRRPWSAEWEPLLVGRRVRAVRRRGKWIVIDLAGGASLVVHLGMTGQLTVTPADQPLADHTHLVFGLDRGTSQLRFRDIRPFGSPTLLPHPAALAPFFPDPRLRPEPF